jgi:hypothetical protein
LASSVQETEGTLKGRLHYIEADLSGGWMLAGLVRLELYLKKHADFEHFLARNAKP